MPAANHKSHSVLLCKFRSAHRTNCGFVATSLHYRCQKISPPASIWRTLLLSASRRKLVSMWTCSGPHLSFGSSLSRPDLSLVHLIPSKETPCSTSASPAPSFFHSFSLRLPSSLPAAAHPSTRPCRPPPSTAPPFRAQSTEASKASPAPTSTSMSRAPPA